VLSETLDGLRAGADHDVDICYFEHTIFYEVPVPNRFDLEAEMDFSHQFGRNKYQHIFFKKIIITFRIFKNHKL